MKITNKLVNYKLLQHYLNMIKHKKPFGQYWERSLHLIHFNRNQNKKNILGYHNWFIMFTVKWSDVVKYQSNNKSNDL